MAQIQSKQNVCTLGIVHYIVHMLYALYYIYVIYCSLLLIVRQIHHQNIMTDTILELDKVTKVPSFGVYSLVNGLKVCTEISTVSSQKTTLEVAELSMPNCYW